jgi:hypothetical protein
MQENQIATQRRCHQMTTVKPETVFDAKELITLRQSGSSWDATSMQKHVVCTPIGKLSETSLAEIADSGRESTVDLSKRQAVQKPT